jgi:hypothetical protein
MRHLADEMGWDFEDRVDGSREVWREEVEEEQEAACMNDERCEVCGERPNFCGTCA